jgi:hypothetical protein
MEFLERLRDVGRLRLPAYVVFHGPSVPPEAVCATIRAHIGRKTVVARLRSDALSSEEGEFVHGSLLAGLALVLIGGGDDELPAMLLEAWDSFYRSPQHTYTDAHRYIHFTPDDLGGGDRAQALGMLLLVVPRGYGRKFDAPVPRTWIDSVEELGPPAAPLAGIRDLGRTAVAMSMKTLCFLHHRDPPDAEHHGSLDQMFSGERPLTWRDLRRALQQQADANMFDILEALGRRGRVSPDQLDLAAAAIPFVRRETEERERIGASALAPSIYHALWTWEPYFEGRSHVFRGQRDSRWRQDTTLLRAEPDGAPATLGTIVGRLQRTQAFVDALAARERDLVGRALDEDERLAIAQHYGLPTAFLDYTRSLAVAAFFATGSGDGSVLGEGDIGVIYYLSPTDAVAALREADTRAFDFSRATGLRLGRLRTIEPGLPDAENRIARQMGLFVDGFDSRDLQRMSSRVLYFRQQPGEAFEDAREGVTRDRLLAPDATLQKLADTTRAEPPRLSSRLADVRIPGEDLLGALGLNLSVNLRKGQDFLNAAAAVAQRLSPQLWPAIREILTRHLNEARIKARTADVSPIGALTTGPGPAGITYVLDEVEQALVELAALANLSDDALTRLLHCHRPVLGPVHHPVSVNDPIDPPSNDPTAHLVTAVATFVVGLEYLRTVRGEMAMHYFQNASQLLDRPPGNP